MKKPKIDTVSRTFTLSLYDNGRHHFDQDGPGSPSFAESISPLHFMIQDLFFAEVPLGSKIRVTMSVVPKTKKRSK